MDIKHIVNLTSRAWSLPILAAMHSGVAGRQAPLLHATGASRTAFAQSMLHLITLGCVERNPGYGHPLRPEFRLTEQGIASAELAHRVKLVAPDASQALLRKSWTLPLLTSLNGPRRFNDIQRDLLSITDRALSQSLRRLEDHNWVKRSVDNTARPPRPLYAPINAGKEISLIAVQSVTLQR